jgi:ribosomal small subunit protein bTHX
MGKGDKKSAKGKRIMGSFGKVRKRKASNGYTSPPKSAENEETVEKKAPAKKPTAKTTAAKKPTAKKPATKKPAVKKTEEK